MTNARKSRIAILRERLKTAEESGQPTYDVPFRGKNIPLRKIQVETEFPLYRIQSGRTRRAQSRYLDEHPDLPADFFSDPEDPQVQKAQHELLLRLIGEMELDKDLEEKGQRSPLILTFDGAVVDGNRRLAALREETSEYVDAVVLPEDAQNHEIYETELELQMQRETKARYNWIDQALHLEYGITQLHEKVETLANRMRLSVEEVQEELSKLKLVRLYLDWLGQPNKYHKVPSDSAGSLEQAFEDIEQRLSSAPMKRKAEAERRMIRNACFAAIHRQAGYQDIRNLIRHLSQDSRKVLTRVKEREPALGAPMSRDESSAPAAPPLSDSSDPLIAIMGEVSPVKDASVDELLAIVTDPAKKEKAGTILLEVVEELEAEAKDAKQAQVPLRLVQRAVSDLKKIDLDKDTEHIDQIAKALSDVFTEAERVKRLIETLQSES